jgi:hypothetical protein
MKNTWISGLIVAAATVSVVAAPATSHAQSLRDLERLSQQRQKTKNDWRNIAFGAGALGVLGLLRNDSTLTFAGATGALYSAYRYEEDRKSQSKSDRARAAYFSRPYFDRDGYRHTRNTRWKNGKKYFYFSKKRLAGKR